MSPRPALVRAALLQHRLDALRRKCTTGYGCGSTCISMSKQCRKTPSAGPAQQKMTRILALAEPGKAIEPRALAMPKSNSKQKNRSAVFYEDKTSRIFQVRLSGEGKHEKVWAEVETKPKAQQIKRSKLAAKAMAIAKDLGIEPLTASEQGKESLATKDVSFKVGASRGTLGYGRMGLSGADGALLAREIFRQTKDFIRDTPDGSVLTCTAFNGDGRGHKRRKMYEALGFQFLPRTSTGVAVVKDGKIVKPNRKRMDTAATSEEAAFIEAALQLPEFGGGDVGRQDADILEARIDALRARCGP